jgi:hypothetical protein
MILRGLLRQDDDKELDEPWRKAAPHIWPYGPNATSRFLTMVRGSSKS